MNNDTIAVGSIVFRRDSGDRLGRVVYGPFKMGDSGHDLVLVADDANKVDQFPLFEVTASQPFQVGQEVRLVTRRSVSSVKVAAGPFVNVGGDTFYVIQLPTGRHSTATPNVLEPLETTQSQSRFVTWRSVWYDTSAAYTDRDGDVWEFTGRRSDNQPLMSARYMVGYKDWKLSEVVEKFGPLKKREG